jgi:hypothetical protein
MAKQVQFRRGTTSQHGSFTGAVGEVTVDIDKDVAVVHDGSTAGGHPLAKTSDLGTAAFTAATAYATAAQGTTADAALPKAGGTMSGDIDGNGNKVLFANVYSTTNDLPSASTYHGMFAHVHATGKAVYAHSGSWVELANSTDLSTVATSGSYADLSNKPTIPVVGTDALAYDANLQGFVTALTLPTSDGSSGQALVTDGSGAISFGSAGISTGKAIAMAIVFG